MFNFFDMLNTYEQRKVDHTEVDALTIDTCAVNDSRQPYETAVSHPEYDHGSWIIVEMYSDKDSAQKGHLRWVEKMTTDLPDQLVDVSTSEISLAVDEHEDPQWRIFKRKPSN
jgi:hypothetical protein